MDQAAARPLLTASAATALSLALAACATTMLGVWFGFVAIYVLIFVVVVFLVVRRATPAAQVAFLMVAIQLNIFSIEFGDRLYTFENFFTLRPAVPVAAIMLSLLLWRLLNGKEKLGYQPLIKPLLLLNAAFFLATLLHPGSALFFRGLISCVLLALDIGIFLIFFRHLLPDRKLIDRATRWLITMYALYAVAGILMVLLNVSGLDPHNRLVQIDTLGNYTMTSEGSETPIPRPWSFEPNTGSQMAAVCLLALTKAMQRDELQRRLLWFCAFVIFLGVILSFARGAWVGVGVGFIGMLTVMQVAPRTKAAPRPRVFRILFIITATVVGSYLALVSLLPYLRDVLIDRLLTLGVWGQGTMYGRYVYWLMLIADGLKSPVIGHGGAAYRALLPAPLVPESFLIETFHSAGLVGVAAFVWFQIHLFRRALHMLRSGRHLEIRWVMPFVVAYAGYFVSVQTNPNVWGAFYWMFVALFAATLYQGCSNHSLTLSVTK